jgi:hypothetical protein
MEDLNNSNFQALQSQLKSYSFKYNERIDTEIFDVVIYDKSNNAIGIIEIRDFVGGIGKKALGLRNNPSFQHKVFIVIHKENYRIYDISKNSEQEKPLYQGNSLEKVISAFAVIINAKSEEEIENYIYKNLRKLLFTFFTPNDTISDYKSDKGKEFNELYPITKIKNSVYIDKTDKVVKSISKSKDSYETLLLNVLIEDLEAKDGKIKLFRYSTLEAIFSTLKYFTYRLNGIQGMNDQKEGLFLFEKLFENDQDFNDRINDIFISSCSTKYDNLTMWRLYGDNSKGASITLELNEDYKSKPFYIKRLYYRNFDRIKSKIQLLNAQINELGYNLDSRMFSLFPFFIKSNHYDIEAEVRILYDKSLNGDNSTTSCEWGISEPYKIIRPYVDIKIFKGNSKEYNEILPFKIKEIILGPNCPFSKRNIEQIKYYLKINGLDDIDVRDSKIDKDTYVG